MNLFTCEVLMCGSIAQLRLCLRGSNVKYGRYDRSVCVFFWQQMKQRVSNALEVFIYIQKYIIVTFRLIADSSIADCLGNLCIFVVVDSQFRLAILLLHEEFMADAFHTFRVAFIPTADPAQFVRAFYTLQNRNRVQSIELIQKIGQLLPLDCCILRCDCTMECSFLLCNATL